MARVRARDERPAPAAPAIAPLGLAVEGWRALAWGAGPAILLPFLPLLQMLLLPLVTLCHELGHTAFNWLFGYPALPAFDFSEGGGVTTSDLERSPVVVAGFVLGLAVLGYAVRGSRARLAAVVLALALYGLAIRTGLDERLIVGGGHLFEVALGAAFLYRGLTGFGCRAAGERPLSCFVGLWMVLHVAGFAWDLSRDAGARLIYAGGKRGIDPDLITLGQLNGWSLGSTARALLGLALLALPATVIAAGQHARIQAALGGDADD